MLKVRNSLIIAVSAVLYYLLFERRTAMDVEPLKRYAVDCIPCKEESNATRPRNPFAKCDYPPVPNDEVIRILDRRVIDEDYKKWVLLTYMKLYENQVPLYHQSFDIREPGFILTRFKKGSALAR